MESEEESVEMPKKTFTVFYSGSMDIDAIMPGQAMDKMYNKLEKSDVGAFSIDHVEKE